MKWKWQFYRRCHNGCCYYFTAMNVSGAPTRKISVTRFWYGQ